MASTRPAAVAGTFYPHDAKALARQVDELLGGVEHLAPKVGFPKALIVPHAGYVYSGRIAARAYDELSPARGIVERVVIVGPVHRVPVRGLAVPSARAFATPLGEVPIDREAMRLVQDLPQVVLSDPAHALEHSLEVQLPFLQRLLGPFALVPFAVGEASPQEVGEVLERLWGGPETLVVLSTDLSHYHTYEDAKAVDASTIARIAGFATDIQHEEACGATPLNGLLHMARRKALASQLLGACNSGDSAGGRHEVVGYCAFALREGPKVSHDDVGSTLLSIARGSIEGRLFQRARSLTEAGGWLAQVGSTFVTLMRAGSLRGCIGSLDARRPLGEDVADNALGAAFRDPRFAALGSAEWPQCSVEVSLLSAPKAMCFADEDDLLARLCPGKDGVILELAARRATFLPQVWESLPEKRQFMTELLRKAGLPRETLLADCKISRYRVAKWAE